MEARVEYYSLDPNDGEAYTMVDINKRQGVLCAVEKKHEGPLRFSIFFPEKRAPETPLVARQLRSEHKKIKHKDLDMDISQLIEEYWL